MQNIKQFSKDDVVRMLGDSDWWWSWIQFHFWRMADKIAICLLEAKGLIVCVICVCMYVVQVVLNLPEYFGFRFTLVMENPQWSKKICEMWVVWLPPSTAFFQTEVLGAGRILRILVLLLLWMNYEWFKAT